MESLALIVGLGNPGRGYAETRHNAGFMALDQFAAQNKIAWAKEGGFEALIGRGEGGGRRVLLCKPQTFMNSSGTAVHAVASYFKVETGSMLVVVDDADLPFGDIRLRQSGSSGGHHGLESIERHLGTRNYARLRIGIGRRVDGVREITNYVLGRFEKSDEPLLLAVLERVCRQMNSWLANGVAKAMNDFNGSVNLPLPKES